MNYLFWNTNNRNDINCILKILIENLSCDIIGLAEYNDNISNLIKELSEDEYELFHVQQVGCDRIELLTKYPPSYIKTYTETSYYTIKKIPHDTLGYIITSFVHLPSKLYKDNIDKFAELSYIKQDIEKAEVMSHDNKSIIIGDFNVNPFEEPMLAASALHSLSSRNVARKVSRIVEGHKYSMFYNPMWNLLGDLNGLPGTYYYADAKQVNYFWNVFDQVIIRPSLINNFDINSLQIIKEVGNVSLIDENGHPKISDHLPIYFKIN